MIGQEEKNAVMRVLDRGILSGYQGNWSDSFFGGPEIKALEKEWAEYFGVKHAIACNSATSGLWLACSAVGLQRNDTYDPWEVIVTPYSMTCSASVPLLFDCRPVFADIERNCYCLDPESVERAITEHTRAIIAVDLFGQPYNAYEINYIAEVWGKKFGHKIYVIEDAAQAIGAKYDGKYAGTLGDIGVYSLNRHKHIQCGEGGIVVTDNDELAMKIRLAMNHSEAVMNDVYLKKDYLTLKDTNFSLIGMNMRMTEISAAIAREQLKKLPGILENIREYAKYFPVKVRPGCEHSYYRYAFDKKDPMTGSIMQIDNTAVLGLGYEVDNYIFQKFNYKKHYITPLYKMPLFQSLEYGNNICPVCEEVDENIVLAWLKDSDM